jgi:hypothetical protein
MESDVDLLSRGFLAGGGRHGVHRSSDDAVLATTGTPGSCVAAISPGAYSSAVIEAYIYFPPLPGKPDTIADWTSFWLTDQATWPVDGELDAVEAETATGVNAVAWHWGDVRVADVDVNRRLRARRHAAH